MSAGKQSFAVRLSVGPCVDVAVPERAAAADGASCNSGIGVPQ
jgi:hypothetical protein